MKLKPINEKFIFWDWNGTLLNDTEICIDVMNDMLSKRNLTAIDAEHYKSVFGFPVIEYYKKLGFDFRVESFEQLSVEFIDAYTNTIQRAGLADQTEQVIRNFYSAGHENVIVSAMKQNMLEESVHSLQLGKYFTTILGIQDIYAAGKAEMAIAFVRSKSIDPADIVFIGDTTHDYEVACEIGCRCILIADGHQSEERLRATGAEVIPTLAGLLPSIVPKSF